MKANSSSPLPLELAVLKATTKPVAAVAASTAPASSGAAPARPAAAPQAQQASEPDRPEDAPPAPRKDLSPAEAKWDKVMWAMRRTKNRKYVVGPILRNVEVPEPEGGKISLRFKSNALKKNFMEEMGDKRSREALKTAITDAYGSELELEVRSPHEVAEDEAKANGGNGGSQPTSTAQESAMVRAAMAMGAKVVVEDAADGDSQD